MRKIAIVTDTASDLSISEAEEYNIKMLHYQIVYKERTYKDQLEIHPKEVLDDLEREIPSTSLPSLDEIHRVFEEIKNEGYEGALVIPLSSGLSGCYNAVNMVKEEFKEEFKDNLKIVVYDSKTISAPQAVLAKKAATLADQDMSMEEMISVLDKVRSEQHTFFIVDTLKYLLHGGRIGHVSATVGTLLNLKPIITIGNDGKYETVAKVRGRTKAIKYIASEAGKILSSGQPYKIYFSHANGEEIKAEIVKELQKLYTNIYIEGDTWISPVACVHCGPGYVGMLIQKE